MMAKPLTAILLGLSMATGCLSDTDSAADLSSSEAAVTTVGEIKAVPAVNRQRYPDSIGYLYEGSLARVFWLQNQPRVTSMDDLVRRIDRSMARGAKGEFVS